MSSASMGHRAAEGDLGARARRCRRARCDTPGDRAPAFDRSPRRPHPRLGVRGETSRPRGLSPSVWKCSRPTARCGRGSRGRRPAGHRFGRRLLLSGHTASSAVVTRHRRGGRRRGALADDRASVRRPGRPVRAATERPLVPARARVFVRDTPNGSVQTRTLVLQLGAPLICLGPLKPDRCSPRWMDTDGLLRGAK